MNRLAAAFVLLAALHAAAAAPALPQHLRDTGWNPRDARLLTFTPLYPLWADGADKQRWLQLPAGRAIDARDADAWQFPPGTKLWKQFSHAGKPVETRFIERLADGSWRYAAYVWNDDASDATLAPEKGIAALPAPTAPGGRYAVPARGDCVACHGSAAVPVLGVGAVQLANDLRAMAGRGVLRGLPAALRSEPPRIPAASDNERATLGYLHGNCGHCHNGSVNRVPLRLNLAQSAAAPAAGRSAVLTSTVNATSRYVPPGFDANAPIVAPGAPQASVLWQRMHSRHTQVQMPPLGTQFPDPEGLALVHQWIGHDLAVHQPSP